MPRSVLILTAVVLPILVVLGMMLVAWRRAADLAGEWIIDGGDGIQARITARADAPEWMWMNPFTTGDLPLVALPRGEGSYSLSATGALRAGGPTAARTGRFSFVFLHPRMAQAMMDPSSHAIGFVIWFPVDGTGVCSLGVGPGSTVPVVVRHVR
ncbi:MAG: hypothetical protein RLZZ127_2161 [Planctomycetota bacterium]|jgi:hypothetical protein